MWNSNAAAGDTSGALLWKVYVTMGSNRISSSIGHVGQRRLIHVTVETSHIRYTNPQMTSTLHPHI